LYINTQQSIIITGTQQSRISAQQPISKAICKAASYQQPIDFQKHTITVYQCTVVYISAQQPIFISAHSNRFLYQRTATDFYISAQRPIFISAHSSRFF